MRPTSQNNPLSCFVIKIERPGEDRSPGFVIAVGKRVLPKAADRNLLKRRTRAALRELGHYNLGKKFRIRIMALPAAKTANYEEIKSTLDRELCKLITHHS